MSLFLWPPNFPSPSMVTFSQLVACSASWPMVDFMEIAQSWGWHCGQISCNICLYVYVPVPCMHVCMLKCTVSTHIWLQGWGMWRSQVYVWSLHLLFSTLFWGDSHWPTSLTRMDGVLANCRYARLHPPACTTLFYIWVLCIQTSRLILLLANQTFPHWDPSSAQLCVLKIKISVCK